MTEVVWIALARIAGAVPLFYLLAAGATGSRRTGAPIALLAWLVSSVGFAGWVLSGGAPYVLDLVPGLVWTGVRVDGVTWVMLELVTLLGWVIARYAATSLRGDPRRARFLRALYGTLAFVTTLVQSNHLLVIAACWTATSFTVHRLLTHFPTRRAAIVAARKKFITSRLADVALGGALLLLGWDLSTWTIDGVAQAVRGQPLSPALEGAAALFALCGILRSAQLPFHGWLTQVMEAPTAASALLHAGVVNIACVVLLRLAPLVEAAVVAPVLLVASGTFTAVVAGLVMTTRVSVKASLAWSTLAQMGFMLVECGLGAWPLALLHLVAHSLYKAHAFLTAGSAVERWLAGQLVPAGPAPRLGRTLVAAALSVAAALVTGAAFGALHQPALWATCWVLGLAITPLARHASGPAGWSAASLVAALYFGWHELFEGLQPMALSTSPWAALAVIVSFSAAFVVHAVIEAWPDGSLARGLLPWVRAGLHLDDLFVRATWRVWHPQPTQESAT